MIRHDHALPLFMRICACAVVPQVTVNAEVPELELIAAAAAAAAIAAFGMASAI
jgi:hypothetical protein